MKKKIYQQLIVIAAIACCLCACKQQFKPDIIDTESNYLVVEGVINPGTDSTYIKLSRTTKLSEATQIKFELKAKVFVTDDQNIRHDLTEMGSGIYASPAINIPNAQQCQLHIVTSDQKEYVSDNIVVNKTPPIDTISYDIIGQGFQFYVSSHDVTNKVQYYRWDFDETWEYQSLYGTSFKFVTDHVEPRAYDDRVLYCWATYPSHQILLGSTATLSQAVINRQPITYVDANSGKLSKGYSMLLKQYALTKDAYEYWQKLKKNTEQLGSIFDAQPSEIKGNMHATANPKEPVIGFVTASTVSTKRIMITSPMVTFYTDYYYPFPSKDVCDSAKMLIKVSPQATFVQRLKNTFAKGDTLITDAVATPGGDIVGYYYYPADCVDCRIKSPRGTNVKPSFWLYQ